MSYFEHTKKDVTEAYQKGREEMLREILTNAGEFRAKLVKRRYFNNAAGVGRFAEFLDDKLNQELIFPKGQQQ